MRLRPVSSLVCLLLLAADVPAAKTIIVAPSTGAPGLAITKTVEDAISQVNAAADTSNTIVLRSTEGPIILPPNATWTITTGKSVEFRAETGQPVVRLSWARGRYMLTIAAGTNANNQAESVIFTGIAFIPQPGLEYANNIADGINCAAGRFAFTDCVFSSNDGSDGVASQEGALPFVQGPNGNNVGDDWIQFNTYNSATLSNCTVTGASDDAILFGGGQTPALCTLRLVGGTCVANNGGAGIQVFGDRCCLELDGTRGRVLVADNGRRSGSSDTGVKFFGDRGCAFFMRNADIVGSTNGGFFDFSGVPVIRITDSRIALNNTADAFLAGNFSTGDADAGGVGDSGDLTQNIVFNRVTIHDARGTANPGGIQVSESANDPRQAFVFTDSILSGAGDSFAHMTNGVARIGPSPPPVVRSTAVVTKGPHAIAATGPLGDSPLNGDPKYASLEYKIGRNQANPDFLLPTSPDYATASSTKGQLRGGATGSAPRAAE